MRNWPVLSQHAVLTIERFKRLTVAVYLMGVILICLPFMTLYVRLSSSHTVKSVAAAAMTDEVISHTVVNVDPAKLQAALAAQQLAAPKWPIAGRVTTEFGVPHRPWQRTHSGMDISSGKASGTTAVHAFKGGTVSSVVRSYTDLGNHVVVDHGEGISSVYGHLYSVRVTPGQKVTNSDILGYEGSTGMSTGTHLHFEIRQNGTAVNPRRFLTGNP